MVYSLLSRNCRYSNNMVFLFISEWPMNDSMSIEITFENVDLADVMISIIDA